ncbi:MAG: HEAT repeat domain-containing protein [Gemmatimonadaceae bacterium]
MTVAGAVLVLLPAIGVLTLAAILVIFVHAVALRVAVERRERALEPARRALVTSLAQQNVGAEVIAQLTHLSRRRQTRLFVELARMLSGEDRALLTGVARELGLIDTARELIASPRWWKRLEGARLLNLCDISAQDAPVLLRDAHPLVRAAGAEIIAIHGAPADLELVVPLLRDDAEVCRFAARDTLMRGGRAAEDVVAAHLATDDAVTAEALLQVASSLGGHRFLDVALTRSTDASPRVRVLAATLLGAIGNPRATERLGLMLGDVAPDVRWTAADALASLEYWPAGPMISALLDDPEWEVRRRAAIALWKLGAPGVLLLRRALRSGTDVSQRAARYTLDFALASEAART